MGGDLLCDAGPLGSSAQPFVEIVFVVMMAAAMPAAWIDAQFRGREEILPEQAP